MPAGPGEPLARLRPSASRLQERPFVLGACRIVAQLSTNPPGERQASTGVADSVRRQRVARLPLPGPQYVPQLLAH